MRGQEGKQQLRAVLWVLPVPGPLSKNSGPQKKSILTSSKARHSDSLIWLFGWRVKTGGPSLDYLVENTSPQISVKCN